LRIASIATLYPNAATPQFGTFVARQFEALAQSGEADITVFNPIGVPPIALGRYRAAARAAQDGLEGGVHVYRPTFPLIPRYGARFNPRLIAHAVLPMIKAIHERAPFDLIDAQFFYPDGPAAAQIARDLGLPLSIKARGADISFWGGRPFALKAMRAAGQQAGGLLSVSEQLARDMAHLGMPRDKITIHYTGLDRERFRPANRGELRAELSREMALPVDGRLIACVGALIPRKGQALVLEALRDLPDCRLALAGTGPERAALERQSRAAGLADRVHFLGSLDHDAMPRLLAAAEAMVLASASEGLANAWVEALACGCPLVICDVGGARELVRTEECGRIVERLPASIAQGVRDVLRQAFAPQSVADCVSQFSWQANARQLAAYYRTLI
jgi:glycosyltransferase involved in cell wall biosynthesis